MEEMFRRRRLPHWDLPGATYFITTCLEGSIPAEGLLDVIRYRTSLDQQKRPEHISEMEWKERCGKLMFARYDDWLDTRPAARHLADAGLAKIVVDSLYHFAGERYDMSYDHCVRDEDELERIMHYVELNPVKAGHGVSRQEWKFSSAFDRMKLCIPFGRSLIRP